MKRTPTLKPLLACAAAVLAASATLTAAGTARAVAPAGAQEGSTAGIRADLSDFLAGQLPGLTGRTTVMVHGTSITAAPHVAGIVAQLFQAAPDATPADIERALKVSAHKFTDGAAYRSGPLGTTSYDKGHGLVDVVAAVSALG